MVSVIVADDHAMFVEGLASMLSSAKDIRLLAMTRNGNEALN